MKFFDKIIHFFNNDYVPVEQEDINEETITVKPCPRKSFDPSVNPSTGMPMIGSVDCMGNPFGQRSMHETNYAAYEYHRYQSSYQSTSYFDNRWTDPFNRY